MSLLHHFDIMPVRKLAECSHGKPRDPGFDHQPGYVYFSCGNFSR